MTDAFNRASHALYRTGVTADEAARNLGRTMSNMGSVSMTEREAEAARVVRYRAKIMGAGTAATAWGVLGARNAVKAGESAHRAIEVGVTRVTDVMEAQE